MCKLGVRGVGAQALGTRAQGRRDWSRLGTRTRRLGGREALGARGHAAGTRAGGRHGVDARHSAWGTGTGVGERSGAQAEARSAGVQHKAHEAGVRRRRVAQSARKGAARGSVGAWPGRAAGPASCALGALSLFLTRFDSVLFLSQFLDIVREPGS